MALNGDLPLMCHAGAGEAAKNHARRVAAGWNRRRMRKWRIENHNGPAYGPREEPPRPFGWTFLLRGLLREDVLTVVHKFEHALLWPKENWPVSEAEYDVKHHDSMGAQPPESESDEESPAGFVLTHRES